MQQASSLKGLLLTHRRKASEGHAALKALQSTGITPKTLDSALSRDWLRLAVPLGILSIKSVQNSGADPDSPATLSGNAMAPWDFLLKTIFGHF